MRLRFTRTAETARSEKRALSEILSARTARDKRCHARNGLCEKLYDTARGLRACVSRAAKQIILQYTIPKSPFQRTRNVVY